MNHIVYWVTLATQLKDICLSCQTDPSLSNLFIYLSFSPSPDIFSLAVPPIRHGQGFERHFQASLTIPAFCVELVES